MLELNRYLKEGQTTVSNLLITHYHELGLTNEEFLLYMHLLKFNQEGKFFPELSLISQKMGLTVDKVFGLIESLISKKIIELNTTTDELGKKTDAYELTVVYLKIQQFLGFSERKTQEVERELKVGNLYQMFEQEFGRLLSPFELETISHWIEEDKYDLEVIRLALKEAVLNQAYSLNYIDRILLTYERKNLTSKAQVVHEQERRKKSIISKQGGTEQQEPLPKVPLYNWVDPKREQNNS